MSFYPARQLIYHGRFCNIVVVTLTIIYLGFDFKAKVKKVLKDESKLDPHVVFHPLMSSV